MLVSGRQKTFLSCRVCTHILQRMDGWMGTSSHLVRRGQARGWRIPRLFASLSQHPIVSHTSACSKLHTRQDLLKKEDYWWVQQRFLILPSKTTTTTTQDGQLFFTMFVEQETERRNNQALSSFELHSSLRPSGHRRGLRKRSSGWGLLRGASFVRSKLRVGGAVGEQVIIGCDGKHVGVYAYGATKQHAENSSDFRFSCFRE